MLSDRPFIADDRTEELLHDKIARLERQIAELRNATPSTNTRRTSQMSEALRKAALQALESLDVLVKKIERDAPDLSGKSIGPAIQKLLLQGKVVKIPELGSFKIATSPERYYTDVNTKQNMLSHGSFKLKFVFVEAIRKKISTNLKKLMVQTMRLPADSLIEK